ncbi:UNVERIFIED_CONTAM: putative mitochondrial protein [Sesamum latifolium]|uniref:Mitochondrial protein n=1 Tax=Sesamum latifolium TaxID=2727402 RepID=A0AAW2VFG2_9LAMI
MSDIDSDKWLEAMKSEMDSLGSNEVWTLVHPPKGVRPVGCKWVYKRKLGTEGEVTAFMARLVAKGFTQRPRVDFEKTYLSVAMAKSIRILLAKVAWYDYQIWQMDMKTVSSTVLLRKISLWISRRVSLPLEKNIKSVVSKGPFIASNKLLETGTQVLKSYGDMGEASYILGIKIYRDRSRRMLGLTQSSYIEKVLKIQDGELKMRIPSNEAWD